MCGIAGVIAWEPNVRVTREQLDAMSDAIAHRGPDGCGTWIGEHGHAACGLAHRRLAILDPDARANQPFCDHHGRQLVYNGEIYNFRDLKSEISTLKPDYPWRTECDTEVLLAAYETWGERCVERFDGMFAFAIFDPTSDSVFLARDRMGQKPLYAAIAPSQTGHRVGAIAFSSELGALRKLPWVDQKIDQNALGHYLRWGYMPAPLTIYRGCEKLPPARWMRVTRTGIEIQQYFDPNARRTLEEAGRLSVPGAVATRARELLLSAVKRQLVSDVPLGCFLSGGIDSSIIAAAMKHALGGGQAVHTFSIGFDDPRYDETRYAGDVARHLGTKHEQFIVRPDAIADLPKLAEVFGEPFADSSALPTHYLARETRRFVKVALSGDGGDELFGGYDRYRATWMADAFQSLPLPLKNVATRKMWELLPAGKDSKSATARLKRLLHTLNLPGPQRYDAYMRFFDEETIAKLCRGETAAGPATWLQSEYNALLQDRDAVQASMALDRLTYLPEDLLTKVDRASMLHALEVRSPFMDPAVVAFAAGLTTEQLFGGRSNARAFMQMPMSSPAKMILRDAFAKDLPSFVFKRPKMGFAVPIGQWFRGDLRAMLNDSLTAADSFATAHFDMSTIKRLLAEHGASQTDHAQRLYALLMLELWWRGARSD